MFFCHLAIEKILKAHIVKLTKDHPPRIHELASLLRRTGIEMSNAQHELLGVLMLFHLEGRYSENFPKPVKNKVALEIHAEAKKLFIWLEAML